MTLNCLMEGLIRQRPRSAAIAAFVALIGCAAPNAAEAPAAEDAAERREADASLHHPFALDVEGPETSEGAEPNPFTDYRLLVTLDPPGDAAPFSVRGFYAANGDAADSGASGGAMWRAMVTPDRTGLWRWSARLSQGSDIAIDQDQVAGRTVTTASGEFTVGASAASGPDWRAPKMGRLVAKDGQLIREGSGEAWLKTGTNSPENLLAYEGFDATRRMGGNAREGEADSGDVLHSFAGHEEDWRPGDPQWGEGRGRALIGAMNYLAENGVNASYFLVWNVAGDGKDVWPFVEPEDGTRFDVSKLAQWERVFAHMQARGIALHLVLQETENELLMDGGDTGRERKIFLSELVARFGHHNALIWNLGEENGPVHWRPEGQNDAQRMAMVDWLTAVDPYDHPILLHTHSEPEDKDAIAGPLLGHEGLDGLSLQISDPTLVHAETLKWSGLAREAGRPWVLTMDEIGPWQHGAVPDADAEDGHARLAREVLWGHFLAGGSGVEWYFGAEHDHNDLTAEDFRSRDRLWAISAAARELLESVLEPGESAPCPASMTELDCLTGPGAEGQGDAAIVYVPAGERLPSSLTEAAVEVSWRDPLAAGRVVAPDGDADRVAVLFMDDTR